MSSLVQFDHVGITVSDLDAVATFFVALGFEEEGRTLVVGDFIDAVIGIPGSKSEILMLRPPGGGTALELARFHRPDAEPGQPGARANVLALRNLGFEVRDLAGLLERLRREGYETVGGVADYEGAWRMAHVRGREGIVLGLAERLG